MAHISCVPTAGEGTTVVRFYPRNPVLQPGKMHNHVLKTLKSVHPKINKAYFRQDNNHIW